MKVHNLDSVDSHKSFTNLDCPEYIMFGNIWRIFGYIEHLFAFLVWKYMELKGIRMVGINASLFFRKPFMFFECVNDFDLLKKSVNVFCLYTVIFR